MKYVRPVRGKGDASYVWTLFLCSSLTFGLGLAASVVVGAGCQGNTVKKGEEADMERLMLLRVRHGDTVIDLQRCDGCPNRKALETKLRDITSDHNVILSKHPTWHVQPLDTKVLIR